MLKINVSIGDRIQAGEVAVILEAMKMETEIQSLIVERWKGF